MTAVSRQFWHEHGSHARDTVSDIVDFMSSKTARLRRRHAAQRNRYKRLRKSGRVPQHTRAERRREEVERQRWKEAYERRKKRLRQAAFPVIGSIGAAGIIMFMPLAEASSGHHSYLYLSAADPAASGNPDLPHTPESDGTYYSSLIQAVSRTIRISLGTGNQVRRPRTTSLGTGLSCLADRYVAGQPPCPVVREWPPSTAF